MSLTISFGRYLFWLLGEWTIPLILGAIFGSAYMTYSTLEILEASTDAFTGSIQSVVDSCTAPTDPPLTASPPASVTGPPVAGDGGDTG